MQEKMQPVRRPQEKKEAVKKKSLKDLMNEPVKETIKKQKKVTIQEKEHVQPALLDSPAMSTRSKVNSAPSSPAMGTRSKRKLDV